MKVSIIDILVPLYLPTVVVEPHLVARDEVQDEDLSHHPLPWHTIGQCGHGSTISMYLDIERFTLGGQNMDTKQVDPSDRDSEDAVPDVKVRPNLRDGVREADVAVVVRHGVAEKHVKGNKLSHVPRAGEESLKAWFSRQLLHVTKDNLRHDVVLSSIKSSLEIGNLNETTNL